MGRDRLNLSLTTPISDRFPLSSFVFATTQMLKHGRAGVPLEVMGLMLGDFVDEFTIRVIGMSMVLSLFSPTVVTDEFGTQSM
jgi:hypothetical protein